MLSNFPSTREDLVFLQCSMNFQFLCQLYEVYAALQPHQRWDDGLRCELAPWARDGSKAKSSLFTVELLHTGRCQGPLPPAVMCPYGASVELQQEMDLQGKADELLLMM